LATAAASATCLNALVEFDVGPQLPILHADSVSLVESPVGAFEFLQILLELVISAPHGAGRSTRPAGKRADRVRILLVLRVERLERIGAEALSAGTRQPERSHGNTEPRK
jgi:hypothetical protein